MLSTWKTRARARRGQHRRAEARRVVAAQLLAARATSPRRPGCRQGSSTWSRASAREVGAALVADPACAADQLHRLARDRRRRSASTAARNLVPFTAELGGKGPFVVFADADLDAAARDRREDVRRRRAGLPRGHPAARRVESVRDEFFARFREATDAHVLGDPRDPRRPISPLIHPDHLARVEGFVERARAAGDELAFGGRRWKDDGAVVRADARARPRSNDAEIVQSEVFGPVLTLQTLRRRGRGHRARELHALRPRRRWSSRPTPDARRAAWARRSAPARSGRTASWCATSRRRSAATGISGIGREGGDYALDFYSDVKTSQVKERTTDG